MAATLTDWKGRPVQPGDRGAPPPTEDGPEKTDELPSAIKSDLVKSHSFPLLVLENEK